MACVGTAESTGEQRATCDDATVDAFMVRLTNGAQKYDGPERRSEPRFAITMSVPTQALDESRCRVGAPFVAITRSISRGGIAFYYTKPIAERFLAMQFRDRDGNTMRAARAAIRNRWPFH
jgi:hypothetical protein